jgi:DNA-binding NtrC family response regulator
VLVVDDDPAVRRAWQRALTSHGFHALEARDVDEAIRLIQGNRVVLAWMDAVMPGRPTRDLVAELRRLQPDAKQVICSGHVGEELLRRDLRAGELAFVAKPCPLAVLLEHAHRAAAASGP